MPNLRTCNKRRKRLRERFVAVLSIRSPGKPWKKRKQLVFKGQAFTAMFPGTIETDGWVETFVEIRRRA